MAVSLGLLGCPAHVIPGRPIVRDVNFHGVGQVDEDVLRGRLAVRETPMFPANHPRWLRWWRWWWQEPEYFDETSLTRDRLRIRRFYQARGFYDAEVSAPRLTPDGTKLSVDFDVREGLPTVVADVRLRGCEEADRGAMEPGSCRVIRDQLAMHPGDRFDEDVFAHDREQVADFTREAGFATAIVVPRGIVDPSQRLAWIEYTIHPGPASRFGNIHLIVAPSRDPVPPGQDLPGGLPTAPILSAINIEPGMRYSRRVLAQAQQSLFDLGVFGIARIEEATRADGTVDLDVMLSPGRIWRWRFGVGAEADNTRTNAHGLITYEHRNLFGGMRRLRLDFRPQIFLPAFLGSAGGEFELVPGASVSAELQQPEISPHTSGIVSGSFDLGPDPVNPTVGYRRALRAGVGFEAHLTRQITGSFFVRTTNVAYLPYPHLLGSNVTLADINSDPLFRQQFFDRNYVHFEQSFTWDRRDNQTHPSRGTFLALNLAEGTRSPLSDYTFLRMQIEGRGYVRVNRTMVLAMRGQFGAVVGSSVFFEDQRRWYWPVPPELRFYSGGSQSNRGYPFNRVGMVGSATGFDGNRAVDDPRRTVALGGTAMWEGSMELRWQPGNFGMVAFFDASNVTGIDPNNFINPTGVNPSVDAAGRPLCRTSGGNFVTDYTACRNTASQVAAPPPQPLRDAVGSLLDFSTWDAFVQAAHPSVGIGFRYLTPVGPIRLDIGFRLADLGCMVAGRDVTTQNAAIASNRPSYYVLSQPRCSFLFWDNIPATLNFSIGEAY